MGQGRRRESAARHQCRLRVQDVEMSWGSDLYAGFPREAHATVRSDKAKTETPMPGLRPRAARNPTGYLRLPATMTVTAIEIQESIVPQDARRNGFSGAQLRPIVRSLRSRPGMTALFFHLCRRANHL